MNLRALLAFCDVFVNMCSTMSLDAICFDKPVVNPVFGNSRNELYDDQRFLKYAHYERVVKSGAVAIAKTKEALINAINEALEKPTLRLDKQEKLLKLQVGKSLKDTSVNFIDSIKNIILKI